MRDLQDWHKKVEIDAKAAQRALDSTRRSLGPATPPTHSHSTPAAPSLVSEETAAPAHGPNGNGVHHQVSRRGRTPRREETREELLSRLLDPTLTLEETARMLEVCPTTVRRYTNKGILPHERSKGNQRRFKLSSVLAFLESQAKAIPSEED